MTIWQHVWLLVIGIVLAGALGAALLSAGRPFLGPGIPETSASLGGDLRSGMTFEETKGLGSLRDCSFRVEEVYRSEPPEDAPAIIERVQTNAKADSCRHLGGPGNLLLEFANDRLMTVEFVPDDLAAYRAALERATAQRAGEREVIGDIVVERYRLGSDVSLAIVDRDGRKTAIWRDLELAGWLISG